MFRITFFMRIAISFIGIVVLIFSIFLFPELSRESAIIAEAAAFRLSAWYTRVNIIFLLGLYSTAIPFYFALYHTMKLLGYIDKKNAFSELSVRSLRNIKFCAISVCGLYMAGVMPMVICIAELDDAPGLVLMGFIVGLSPFVIATFSAILQKLLQEAIALKHENDLTI